MLNLNFFSNNEIEKLKLICNNLIDNYKIHNLIIDNGGLGKTLNLPLNIIIYLNLQKNLQAKYRICIISYIPKKKIYYYN